MGVLLTAGTGYDLATLLESGTSLLTWFISSMTTVLGFFTSNTALLIWFLVGLVGVIFVYIRKCF